MDLRSFREQLLAAQLAGDRRAALGAVDDALRAGLTVPVLALDGIRWTQAEIGRLWQENVIGIAQEHQATAIAQLVLSVAYTRAVGSSRCGRTVLVACVEGELHDFPARLAADALDLAGFDVRFLGASVPRDSLVAHVVVVKPHLVALSVTMTHHLPALREAVGAIRKATDGRVPILVGGHACEWTPSLRRELAIEGTAADARGLLSEARRVLGLEEEA